MLDLVIMRFSSSHLKLRRARKHIDEVAKIIKDYNADGVKVTANESAGSFSFSMELPPMPEDMRLVLGDAVHNIRSALDSMAVEMADMAGKDGTKVSFPFAKSAAELGDQIRRKNFHWCGEDAVSLVTEFAPYVGGNEQLRAIHDLDMIDKHRGLMPVPAFAFDAVTFTREDLGDGQYGPITVGLPENQKLEFRFDPSTNLGEREIVETLVSLVELCESILEGFAALDPVEQATD